MKALIYTGDPANPVEIIDKEKPVVNDNQVLIKIQAAALNHRDQWMRVGKYPGMQAGVTLGSDGCGTIEEVGNGVSTDLMGKTVIINPNNDWGPNLRAQSMQYNILGMPKDGTFAEYITVDQDRVYMKPSHLDDNQAAALPLGGLTAYRASFTHGEVGEGSTVLVTGIGGGVAQYALQFCLAAGATVSVSSSSPDKLSKATGMGAAMGFNYRDDDWTKTAFAKAGGFDVIIDSAGGDAMNDYIKIVRPGGIIVFFGSTLGPSKGVDLFRMFWGQVRLQGSTMGNDQEFGEMVDFVEKHKIVPIVDSVRPFMEIVSAMDEMEQGSQMGKLVVQF